MKIRPITDPKRKKVVGYAIGRWYIKWNRWPYIARARQIWN